jgi:spore germination cell wall hydrolase CwlJ-like protein
MVRVPIWEQNVRQLPGASNTPHATADQFGAQIGAAQSKLGSSISTAFQELGASLTQQQNENDAVESKIAASNFQADVETYADKVRRETPPEQSTKIPQMVDDYVAQKQQEYAPKVSPRYQKLFTLHATNFRNHQYVTNSTFAQNRSFDYDGNRIKQAGGQQAGALIDNPDYIYNAASNLRGIADETSLPEWKRQEVLEGVGQDLIRAGIAGYAKRGDDVGAAQFKARMMTELPVILRLRGALGTPAGPVPGLVERGNIDLGARPVVKNEDGSVSTVRSISIEQDGKTVLIPTVSDDGRVLSDEDAIALYKKTGKHLGVFSDEKAATAYAERLHKSQEQMVGAQFQGPPAVLSPTDRDQVIRTIYGEAGGEKPEGQAAVAAVIRNRMLSGRWGRTASQVVHAPGQFEPWGSEGGRERLQSLKPTDKLYQDIGVIVDQVFNGQTPDPTNGATHFYSPKVQKMLYRQPPDWSKGVKLASIGTHEFYAPEGKAPTMNTGATSQPADPQFFISRSVGKISTDANPEFMSRLQAGITAAEQATGTPIKITSMHRTTQEQAALFAKYQAGGNLAAPPGQSRHEAGAAADLADTPARAWLREHAKEFGLETLKGDVDKPHIQMSRTQLAGPLPSMAGYVSADKWVAFDREMDAQIGQIRAHNEAQKKVDEQNLERELKDESLDIQQNGIGAKSAKITDQRIADLKPNDPTAITRVNARRDADAEYFNKMHNIAADTDLVAFQKVESLKPVTGQNEFAYRNELYKQAQQEALKIQKDRVNDPAAMADRTQGVKQARKAAASQPDGNSLVIDARIKAQQDAGVPPMAVAPITNAEAAELGIKYLSRIGQLDEKEQKATMLEMKEVVEQKYGKKHAFDVFKYAVQHGARVDKDTADSIAAFMRRQVIGDHEGDQVVQNRDMARANATAAMQAMDARRNFNSFNKWWSPKKVTLSDPISGERAAYDVDDVADLWTNFEKYKPSFDAKYKGQADNVVKLLRGAAVTGEGGKPPKPPAAPAPGPQASVAPPGAGDEATAAVPGADTGALPSIPANIDAQTLTRLLHTAISLGTMQGMPAPAGEQPAAPAAKAPKVSLDDTVKHLISLHQGKMTVPEYESKTGRSAARDLETLSKRPGIASEFKVPSNGR